MSTLDRSPEGIARLLGHLPLFQSLNPDHLASIAASTRHQTLDKGGILFNRGDMPHGFHVVIYGQIKLAVSSAQGDEKVIEIIGPRQSFGEAVMFLGRPYPVSAVALEDCVLLAIDQQAVDRLLATDPSFARRLLAGLSIRLHALIQDVESYSMRSSVERVIGYLLQQCPDDPGEAIAIELPTSKLVIASRLNLTPETLSRVFAELSRRALIAVDGRKITIPDPAALRRYGE